MKFLTLSLISVVAITASTLADDSLFFDDPSGLLASNDVNWQDPRPAASLNPGLYATDNVSPNLYVIGDCHPLGQNQPAGKLRARQGILCPNNVAAPPKENPQNQKIDEPNADNSNLIQNPVANPAPPVVEKNEEVCNQQVVAKRPYAVCDSGKYTDRIYKPMTMGSDLRNCEIRTLITFSKRSSPDRGSPE